jgi:multidrug efflux pump subunit AcrB
VNLSRWGIQYPLPSVLLFVVLVIAGLWGWRQLPISQLPDIQLPTIQVTVNLSGAPPSTIETDVTRKVEDAVASIPDIRRLNSSVSEGTSVTRIEFELGRDIDRALDEVRDAVARVRRDLPQDIDEPVVQRIALVGGTLMAYAVESDRLAPDELSWFVDDKVTKALFSVSGVGSVTRVGGVDREVRVDLRPEALQALGVTAGSVSAQLARLQVERPGGRTETGGAEQSVRTVAVVRNAQDLADYPIYLPDGRSVRLSAIATVIDGAGEPRAAAMLDDRQVVGFSTRRTSGSSEVTVGDGIRERIAQLQAEHPEVRFTEVQSTVETAKASYDSSMTMLLEGALLSVLVVWFFLREWRATLISAIALPLSVIPTFAVMQWFGFSLNLLTLLALAVVIGVLVDDAIVEVENVARHRAMGKPPMQAAIDAADEIGIAVIATSVTLAAVFIPVAFMPGVTGKFFREFGWTAAAAVLFSLLVARLLTPMLAGYFMRGEPKTAADSPLMQRYLRWVELALRHRGRALGLAFATFVLSLGLIPLIPKTFVPTTDQSRAQLQVELPPGARLTDSLQVADEVRAKLRAGVPEVTRIFTTVGGESGDSMGGGLTFPEVRKIGMTLQFSADRKRSSAEIEDSVRKTLVDMPGIRVGFAAGGPGDRLTLAIGGRDSEQLSAAAQALAAALRTVPGIGTVTTTAALLRPEIVIRPDPARAADLGVSTVDIADAARIATSGDIRQRLAKLNLAERQVPIRVQLAGSSLTDPAVLRQLRVPGKAGPVPLAAVAEITEGSGPARIDRLNRERTVTVSAELNGLPLGDVMAKVNRMPAMQNLPPGVRILPAGDSEAFVELFVGFVLALLAGIVSVYLVLLLLFHSGTQPLVILAVVPLCGGGAFGLLLLTGIAVKNSILIVDYAILGEQAGLPRDQALIDACRKRARPVIMTTLAMGAGMLPIALGLGADGNFRTPLGVAVIGGLITSTLLSLVVVPAAYSLVAEITETRLRPLLRRFAPQQPHA